MTTEEKDPNEPRPRAERPTEIRSDLSEVAKKIVEERKKREEEP